MLRPLALLVLGLLLAGCTAPAAPLERPAPAAPKEHAEAWIGIVANAGVPVLYSGPHPFALSAPSTVNVTVVETADGVAPEPATFNVTVQDGANRDALAGEGKGPLTVAGHLPRGSYDVLVGESYAVGVPGYHTFRAMLSWQEDADSGP